MTAKGGGRVLNKLVLRNFQRHKKLTLKLGKITTIVGRSDVGKSAIIRSLRWALTNRPAGTGMIRRGTDLCRVSVFIGKDKIRRVRGKKKNVYQLNGSDLKAF